MNQEFGPLRGLSFQKEYTLATGTKIFLYIFLTVMLAGGAGLIYESVTDKSWWVVLIGILIIALCIYIFIELKASKITISESGIKRAGYFSSRELLMHEIKGYELLNGKKLIIRPLDKSNKKISLGDYIYFNDHYEIRTWLTQNCKDLDAEQHQISMAEIQADSSFGYTSEERLAELKRLKRFCSYFNYIGTAICFWLIIYPQPYDYAILAGIVWPWVVMFTFYLKRDVVTFNIADKKKEAVYPSLNSALILPLLALMVRAYNDIKLMHLRDVLLPALLTMLIAGAVFLSILLSAKEKARSNKTTWLNVAAFVLLYGFAAPVLINCNFDYKQPEVYIAQVLSQRVSSGRYTSYNLTLSKWGLTEREETKVSKSLYYEVKVGDTVKVNLKPGLFKIPWFYVSK
jgi:uncharacterized membrane protein YbhN (UPF0104 family)